MSMFCTRGWESSSARFNWIIVCNEVYKILKRNEVMICSIVTNIYLKSIQKGIYLLTELYQMSLSKPVLYIRGTFETYWIWESFVS